MSEISEILDLLVIQTGKGKIKWNLISDSIVALNQAKNILEIRELAPSQIYSFIIRNEDGLILTSENLNFPMAGFDSARNIFQRTKRGALGVDEALENIKNSLRKL